MKVKHIYIDFKLLNLKNRSDITSLPLLRLNISACILNTAVGDRKAESLANSN
jgi:hypothetical protein